MCEVLQRREGAVLTLVFNRPKRKNALTTAMYSVLAEALDAAAADATIKVVVLTGAGGIFTAGNDLGDFMKSPPADLDTPVFDFLRAIAKFPKPLIAAVEGPAVGIGTTMLLHCDLVYAADDAVFQMPFTQLALVPEGGSSLMLPTMIGHRRAAELLFFGDRFDVATAREAGIVNQGLPASELAAFVAGRAARLAALAPAALRETKALMKSPVSPHLEAAMRAEGTMFIERLQSPELAEAIEAFFQKRKPDFSQF
jgi:enoyl-CoA hydratase/carnithine racemase